MRPNRPSRTTRQQMIGRMPVCKRSADLIETFPGEEHMAIQMTEAVSSSPHLAEKGAVDRLFSKISWRILPFLMLCYVIAFLACINIGNTLLQMNQKLTFSAATYHFCPAI